MYVCLMFICVFIHSHYFFCYFQGQIICPCKVPAQAPTNPQTCPVALWICPPAATAPWVATITQSHLHRACQLRTKWTWPRGSPWETMGPGQTWTCSQIKVKLLICFSSIANVVSFPPYKTFSHGLAVSCFASHIFFCGFRVFLCVCFSFPLVTNRTHDAPAASLPAV